MRITLEHKVWDLAIFSDHQAENLIEEHPGVNLSFGVRDMPAMPEGTHYQDVLVAIQSGRQNRIAQLAIWGSAGYFTLLEESGFKVGGTLLEGHSKISKYEDRLWVASPA